MLVQSWKEQALDATLHFQSADFGKQLFVWVAAGGAGLDNLHVAVPLGAIPPVTTLVSSGPADNGAAVAQRLCAPLPARTLAARCQQCSLAVQPGSSSMLAAGLLCAQRWLTVNPFVAKKLGKSAVVSWNIPADAGMLQVWC